MKYISLFEEREAFWYLYQNDNPVRYSLPIARVKMCHEVPWKKYRVFLDSNNALEKHRTEDVFVKIKN